MLLELEFDFEPDAAHILSIETSAMELKMLYQDREIGRRDLWSRVRAAFFAKARDANYADLDLLSMSPYLRRDLGLGAEADRLHLDRPLR